MTTTVQPTAPDAPPASALLFGRRTVALLALATAAIVAIWLWLTPPGILGKADALGYAVCHRIVERSFHIHERPLPLCARCTGIYLGVWAGLGVFAARGRLRAARLPRVRLLAAMLLGVGLYGLDGLNSYLSLFERYAPLYEPHNTLRLLSGTTFGLALITIVWPVFNSLLWRAPQDTPPVRSWGELAALYALAAGAGALVLLDWPPLRAALGAISAAGVLLMFGIVGCTLILGIARRENRAARWRDLIAPALAGLVFALLVTGAIDALRYALTGTWGGFVLP
ncbi:MAG: DUF2085 domain-containing protein [Anaerolineae bacterium]|nr:DUF2085 domain-containing protein [Anaerolineae bacterium]